LDPFLDLDTFFSAEGDLFDFGDTDLLPFFSLELDRRDFLLSRLDLRSLDLDLERAMVLVVSVVKTSQSFVTTKAAFFFPLAAIFA